jgi:uncharacterized membrane protein YccF (DUF307 family)
MRLLLNELWIVFGGLHMAIDWLFAALTMVITIVGIVWARAAVTIGIYTLLLFSHTVVGSSQTCRDFALANRTRCRSAPLKPDS